MVSVYEADRQICFVFVKCRARRIIEKRVSPNLSHILSKQRLLNV